MGSVTTSSIFGLSRTKKRGDQLMVFCVFLRETDFVEIKEQSIVSCSSTEAEYKAMANVTCVLVWLISLLWDFWIEHKQPAILFCDNEVALHIATNVVFHIEIDCHLVPEKIQAGHYFLFQGI